MDFIDMVEAAGIRGRGGGGFPTAIKLRAVRGRHRMVIANGCEGDPLSAKDKTLLTTTPHLVLDGIQAAATAVRATEAVLCVHVGSAVIPHVTKALAERRDRVATRIVEVPDRYVASEESALVNFVTTGDARPTGSTPRPAERGILVDNVDTLAQLALVAKLGPERYRAGRTDLVTVLGAVRRPGVITARPETTIDALLAQAGGETFPIQAVLIGGYGGVWQPYPTSTPLGPQGIAAIYALPTGSCGLSYTADILAYLAAESTRQCGPCMFGLPTIAADFAALVRGKDTTRELKRRLPLIAKRGACAHPDGATRLAASALRTFEQDVQAHLTYHRCGVLAGVA
jgi:NADH:ubiquinone oxidoreductase subunit F (NADH-binding)